MRIGHNTLSLSLSYKRSAAMGIVRNTNHRIEKFDCCVCAQALLLLLYLRAYNTILLFDSFPPPSSFPLGYCRRVIGLCRCGVKGLITWMGIEGKYCVNTQREEKKRKIFIVVASILSRKAQSRNYISYLYVNQVTFSLSLFDVNVW